MMPTPLKETKPPCDSRINKRYGTLYEYLFISEALRRDLEPHLPVGDYLPHDIVIYTHGGNCKRVQVKGTSTIVKRGGSVRYKVVAKQRRGSKVCPIDQTAVDVVACYVGPYDTWYLIPSSELSMAGGVSTLSIYMYPGNPESAGQYEKYRDGWEIFNQ